MLRAPGVLTEVKHDAVNTVVQCRTGKLVKVIELETMMIARVFPGGEAVFHTRHLSVKKMARTSEYL